MKPMSRLKSLLLPVAVLLTGVAMCGMASAAVVTHYYTDDKDSTNNYASAATLNLQDASIDGLNGVVFTLEATLSDPIFAASSKISDLAFNGPSGQFNNFSGALHSSYRGDVLVDAMEYTSGDGATVAGIKFNWSNNGNAFDTGANAFTEGKTSTWFIGNTSVAQFEAAEYQNPFSILHVNALSNGAAMWLLDGAPQELAAPTAVPEPQTWLLLLIAFGAIGAVRGKANASVLGQSGV